MFGLKNYNPKMYTNPSNIIKDHRNALEELIGKNIEEIWVAWEQDEDEWFNDCPVVIRFENCQLELCANKADEYAVTFNKILFTQDLCWYGTDLRLKWEKNKLQDLNSATGKRVVGIEIFERCETNATDYFYLYGIGLYLNDGYLAICNGFDENSLIIKREEGPIYRHTLI
ncbi:hypothetical protein [Peribacillus simplex]|uniref:Uncharacterized protein n=1 Tax=Peribacillus simplex NBRC 15720 = DSM 1321 TaxID=1349754 RepID=A0A223EFT4_9BACI|nr:hypothetical protein [Peribacillus simplex]ASS94118.1 hypothetical protein BS1321_09210 [Peribacillus simplex NBRC 15720 = DSM 1321]MEC1400465.1 hypothetical protein [Peribacillus simplex]